MNIAAPIVIVAGCAAGLLIIPWLVASQRRSAVGQHVYEDGPKTHTAKQGTPTLGGIVFVAAALVGFGLSASKQEALPLFALVLAAGAIGFTDDLLILQAHRALGLRARAKFALLAVVAAAYVTWVYHTGAAGPEQTWFGTTFTLPVWLWSVLALAAIVGAANAVNLTDGLDGLAAGATIPVLIGVQLTARFQGIAGITAVGDGVLGALLVFLWFNRYPARIFMGDTGSLALGALLAGIAIQSHALLLLPLFGLVFVIETLSVIAQVISFKLTGKRIFKMSPLHHHFELSGWRETAVTSTFIVFATVAAAATWLTWWSSTARAVRVL